MAGTGASTLNGASTGATYGATIGSVIPGVGTAVGAVVGSVVGAIAGAGFLPYLVTRRKRNSRKLLPMSRHSRGQSS